MNFKDRTKRALEKYYERQEQDFTPKRKNKKPEKIVEAEVLIWCKQHQWDVDVVDARASFSTATMRYTGKSTSFGLSDIVGNTHDGFAVYIELKAKGRRVGSALDIRQRVFLTRKIETQCFAVVTDSAEYIEKTWKHYLSLLPSDRIVFLLNELPRHNPRQLNLGDDLIR